MLSFNDVAARRDGKPLFTDFSATLHAGEKVGVTGANGTGKSTLFAMIRGAFEPDVGSVSLQRQVTLAHVAQETPATERRALDYVVDGDAHLRAAEARVDRAEARDDGMVLAEALEAYREAGGYDAHARAGALLNGLGFSTPQHDWPVARFSGGWRMRLNLAQALMCPSDLLLLDEPTNHLDLDAVLWLEQWLVQYPGTLLLISHDREFLDRITGHTLHIEHGQVTLYTGNYSAFERARAERLANRQANFDREARRRADLQRFVDRFRAKATKARQAQSRLKMLERLTAEAPIRAHSPFTFGFGEPVALPDPLVVLDRARLGYGADTVIDGVSLTIGSGDRIGLLGANGAGKSTLIRSLLGELPLLEGDRVEAKRLVPGYFAQHTVDQLRGDRHAISSLQALDTTISEQMARDYLGRFGFSGERALQRTDTLSGGERARLALALLIQRRPNLLLLDEPTNHLDIDMRRALAEAMQGFAGALIVVSHDRELLRASADALLLVADGAVRAFDDDLDGYARWLASRRVDAQGGEAPPGDSASSLATHATTPAAGNSPPVNGAESRREAAARRERLRPLKRAMEQADRNLERVENELAELRARLADDGLYNDERKDELVELLAAEATLRDRVEVFEERALDAMEAYESASGPASRPHPT